ncbi:hypothetical protein DY023_06575 [Microbacterium bovistercoris]|uniref:Uncharacterized protein n=1 Tax=Microbacterium bovistercoris TaxID=2293570 RepID=A0A371NUW2_9MICO|nr:hypothetical protein [Microbacterium bovistercoris]REJ06290.1 hypothetical protein DY023_06575 [Microbacterium bovistercoris]
MSSTDVTSAVLERPAWATATEVDDAEGIVTNSAELQFRQFTVRLVHDVVDGADRGTDVLVDWKNGGWNEAFELPATEIPGLIEALRRALRTVEGQR